jgi:Asp-tRNA(Asn)/Glu-tRNA(Gln) amidotransferase A subunit family amidase
LAVFIFFSISGENKHYDSPTNPAAPTRIPGGACSGAAVAVATNAVDFALGEFSSYFFPCLDNLV